MLSSNLENRRLLWENLQDSSFISCNLQDSAFVSYIWQYIYNVFAEFAITHASERQTWRDKKRALEKQWNGTLPVILKKKSTDGRDLYILYWVSRQISSFGVCPLQIYRALKNQLFVLHLLIYSVFSCFIAFSDSHHARKKHKKITSPSKKP